ncbi:MAG: hypothetical protein KC635_25020 [Myxococcales bacterium]|nr:hypothetical protein [Myxococcales bacterium]MCB9733340.1 hypothetical protein [Deltaproteobacteria bacterium]
MTHLTPPVPIPFRAMLAALRWGAEADALAPPLDATTAVRDDGERHVRALPRPVDLGGLPLAAELVFELGLLARCALRAAPGAGLPGEAVAAVEAAADVRLERRDEGYYEGSRADARLTVDLLDGTVGLDDPDAL